MQNKTATTNNQQTNKTPTTNNISNKQEKAINKMAKHKANHKTKKNIKK